MPNEAVGTDVNLNDEKKKLSEEKKLLKQQQKEQKKEAKRRAKEIAAQEAELGDEQESGGVSVVLVTFFIVLIWIAILCLLVKLDVGGFGSGVLAPVLRDVPVLNKILPSGGVVEVGDESKEAYGGYNSLREAVEYIKELELELERAQTSNTDNSDYVSELEAEVERLKEFEERQVEFQRIKTEFDEEVVYADNSPGEDAYIKYYESIDPVTAEYLYKQVVQQLEEDKKIQEYVQTYSAMKPKEAAGIFESLTDNLELVAKILGAMEAEDRGKIMGVMDSEVAAMLTKIMDPET